jgi:hypothetical protein
MRDPLKPDIETSSCSLAQRLSRSSIPCLLDYIFFYFCFLDKINIYFFVGFNRVLYAKALGLTAKVNFFYYDILYSFYNIRSTWAFPLIIPPDNAMPMNGSTKESSSKLLYYCVLQIDLSNKSTTLPPSRAWPTPSQKEGGLIPTSP